MEKSPFSPPFSQFFVSSLLGPHFFEDAPSPPAEGLTTGLHCYLYYFNLLFALNSSPVPSASENSIEQIQAESASADTAEEAELSELFPHFIDRFSKQIHTFCLRNKISFVNVTSEPNTLHKKHQWQ